MHRATNGNPLYVDSITHLLVAEERLNAGRVGPANRDGSVTTCRCRRACVLPHGRDSTYLDDESRTILRVAAVIGRTFTLPVLGMVVGRDQTSLLDLLDDAVNRGTIRPSGTLAGVLRVRAHPRPRRALSRTRTEQAGRAALARRQRPRTGQCSDLEPHLAELAHHFLLAIGPGRDADRAIEYSTRRAAGDGPDGL